VPDNRGSIIATATADATIVVGIAWWWVARSLSWW